MQHGRKQPKASKARRTRLGTVFADGSALLTGPDGTASLIVEARTHYRTKNRKREATKLARSSKDRTRDKADEGLAAWHAHLLAPEEAATAATLKIVWARWHALPKPLSNDERKIVLLTTSTYLFPRHIRTAVKLLRRRFGPPLGEKQYGTSVDTAYDWSEFSEYLKGTLALGEGFLRANLAFEKVDNQAPGRVAAYRTHQELLRLNPTILDQKSPSLADVELVRSTHEAYLRARQQAQVLLNAILYPRALFANGAQTRHDAPILTPRPSEKLPRHLQLAQLAGLRKAKRIVEDFMATRFLKLPKPKRDEFLRVFDNPPSLATKCGSVAPWLADNAPLLRRLRAQWNDVQAIAATVFPEADLPASLRNFSDARGIKLNFKRGANFINHAGLTREFVTTLLSPPPRLHAALPAR